MTEITTETRVTVTESEYHQRTIVFRVELTSKYDELRHMARDSQRDFVAQLDYIDGKATAMILSIGDKQLVFHPPEIQKARTLFYRLLQELDK